MKKLYEKHFRVKENEKIRDHVMMVRIFLAAAVVCVSLFSMGITAYAFFTYTVTSSSNIIKAATFALDKSVIDIESSATISPGSDGTYTLTADATVNKKFQLKLKPSAKMTASTGFAKIVISSADGKNVDTLYTEQIRRTDSEYVLEIAIPAGNTAKVKVVDNWGTCAVEGVVASGRTYQPTFAVITTEPIVEENPEEPVVDEPVEEEQVDPEVVDPEVTNPEEEIPDDSVEESVDDSTEGEAPEDVGDDTGADEGAGDEEIPPEGTSEGVK